jgi:uncharacterized protein (UPF0335 family)
MATTKTATEGVNKDHNVADLNKLICGCAEEMARIDDERSELNEQAGDIRERLKNSGVQPEAFKFACKLKKMEVEARNEYLDNLRLVNSALGIGEQMTLLPAGEDDAKDAAHEVKTPETQH